eukprot:7837342-Pyramimonas_sp.AAC.1
MPAPAPALRFLGDGGGDSFSVRCPPGMARSNLNLRMVHSMLTSTAAFESGDSVEVRTPQGWRRVI